MALHAVNIVVVFWRFLVICHGTEECFHYALYPDQNISAVERFNKKLELYHNRICSFLIGFAECTNIWENQTEQQMVETAPPDIGLDASIMACRSEQFCIRGNDPCKKYYMIDNCPITFSDRTVQELCAGQMPTPSENVPVTSLVSNRTYYNHFCAICNKDESTVRWLLQVQCPVTELNLISDSSSWGQMISTAEENGCGLFYTPPPRISAYRCFTKIERHVRSCNVSGNWDVPDPFLEEGCRTYTSPLVFSNHWYRNPFCLLCNMPSHARTISYCESRLDFYNRSIYLGKLIHTELLDNKSEMPKSLFVNPWVFGHKETPVKPYSPGCSGPTYYDTTNGDCRLIQCSPRRIRIGNECVPKFEEANGLVYKMRFSVIPKTNLTICEDHEYRFIWNAIEQHFHIDENIFKTSAMLKFRHSWLTSFGFVRNSFKMKRYIIQIDAHVNLLLDIRMDQKSVEERLVDMYISAMDSDLDLYLHGEKYETSVYHTVHMDHFRQVYVNEHSIGFFVDVSKDLWHVIPSGLIDLDALFSPTNSTVSNLLICPFITIHTTSNYSELFHFCNNEFNVLNVTLPTASIECLQNGSLRICLDVYENLTAQSPMGHSPKNSRFTIAMKNNLLFVCSCVSLACLIVTLITYCAFKALRTLPGFINMCLSLTLFVAQCTLVYALHQTRRGAMCFIIGITLHYFWLATFCWMSICTIHMFRVFKTVAKIQRPCFNTRKCLLGYSLYAFGFPLICVCCNLGVSALYKDMGIVVNMMEQSGVAYSAYMGGICFITYTRLRIGTFLAPIYFILISNSLYFAFSVKKLRNVSRIQSTKLARNKFRLYCKLFSITGLSWLLHIFYIFFTSPYLWAVIEALNNLQGVFVFIAFTCNRNVLAMYKRRFCTKHSATYPKTVTNTSRVFSSTVNCNKL